MRARLSACLLLTAAIAALLVAGCGSGGPFKPGLRGTLARQQIGSPGVIQAVAVGPHDPQGQYYRYRDMLDHLYLNARSDGTYDGAYDTPGLVTYSLTDGATLVGSITASGLRPHFAYQVKLEGQPSEPYPWKKNPDSIENWSNKQIGSVGRWWCADCGWNVPEKQLRRHRNHWIIGYLLFDFFLTDIDGTATEDLFLDSSFHVLWRTDQRSPSPDTDGEPRLHTVTWRADVYTSSFVDQDVSVYPEGETGRPKPGEVTLSAGDYKCRLLLTEESFHNTPPCLNLNWGDTHYENGGFWAHALSDEDFRFTITGGTPSNTGAIAGMVTYSDGSPARRATVTLTDQSSVTDERTTITKGNGRYSFSDVPTGTSRYTVVATINGSSDTQSDVTVEAGLTTTVHLVIVIP